jgi:thymidylate synthase ThyX
LFATEKFAKTADKNPVLTDVHVIGSIRDAYKSLKEKGVSPAVESWIGDLFDDFMPDMKQAGYETVDAYVKDVDDWALKVATMAIPIAEMVHFVFRLSNVTIAFREQLVRHRTNSYWIQSGRITDYSKVFDFCGYNIPESVHKLGPEFEQKWVGHWFETQGLYEDLKKAGVPDEDAREIVGSGATHRLTMGINLRSLIELLKHRTCYIAQGHWVPVVVGIIEELKTKVDPIFGVLGHPPCWDSERKFTACKYEAICVERFQGKDPHPMCPLWLGHQKKDGGWPKTVQPPERGYRDRDREKVFGKLWSRKNAENQSSE